MEEIRALSIFKRREISCDHAQSYNHYVWLQIAFLSKTVQRGSKTTENEQRAFGSNLLETALSCGMEQNVHHSFL
eukprot:3111688-Ditylum_brightwellii.AAC.1